MSLAALVLAGSLAHAACGDIRECQERASTWEDAAWVGVGMGWGTGAVATWSLASDSAALGMAGPISLGTFALATPLMAAAATPSRRAVELSDNALGLELRRRPRYWMLYGAGLGVGLGAIAMSTTDAVPWWVTAGTGAVSGALFTGAAAGFARDARWIRRQAPELHGRPRMMVVPLANGLGLRGRF